MKGDFTKQEVKSIVGKFTSIDFKCNYNSFNMLDVYTNYKNYKLTVHKNGEEKYYFFIYRPTIGMFVNSKNCQRILLKKRDYETVDELIDNVKNIKTVIIQNSVVIKDMWEDITSYVNCNLNTYKIYINASNKFTEDLITIANNLGKLSSDVINKINKTADTAYLESTPHEIKYNLVHSDDLVNDICGNITIYLREIYFNSEITTTEEFIDEFKNITCSLHKLLNDIYKLVSNTHKMVREEQVADKNPSG